MIKYQKIFSYELYNIYGQRQYLYGVHTYTLWFLVHLKIFVPSVPYHTCYVHHVQQEQAYNNVFTNDVNNQIEFR